MRTLIGAAALALSAAALFAQTVAPAQAGSAGGLSATTSLPTNPIPVLWATLSDSTTTQIQRDEAAGQLTSRAPQSPEAADDVLRGLTGGHDQALAVSHAIACAPEPDAQWISPLARLLGSAGQLHDAAARALSRYGDEPTARDALIAFAKDPRNIPPQRASAASALGAFVDKTAAEALVELLEAPHPAQAVSNAAAGALADMTGIAGNGDDPAHWRDWYNGHANLPDAQWKAAVLPGREARLERIEIRQSSLVGEVESLMSDQYHQAPDGQKNALVMRYLNSPEPDVRAIGARIVAQALLQGLPYPSEARDRIAQLIGDSDPQVRLQSAKALQVLVYAPALNALLQQLDIETHTDVKIALLGAISPLEDSRSLTVVRKLLADPSIDVAISAAGTIRQLGKKVADSDPDQAVQTSQDLWDEIAKRAGEPRGAEFKAAAIEAMAPLRDPRRATDFTPLLNSGAPEAIRSAALHALRDLGDKNTSDAVASWLASEPNPALRADAVDALGTTGTFETDAQVLYDHTKPANEPDQTVRDKAWKVWDILLGGCTNITTLNNWAKQMFNDKDWQHWISVLTVLNDNLLKQNKLADLAASEHNTGDAYMNVGRPDQAATHFQNALNYWIGLGTQNGETAVLVDQLAKALLQSKQYDKAVQFGDAAIARNASDGQTIGVDISNYADQLSRNPASHDDAMKLKSLGLNMANLPQQYKDSLQELK